LHFYHLQYPLLGKYLKLFPEKLKKLQKTTD